MRKTDKILCVTVAAIVGILAFILEIDYTQIAAEGLTLSSIVLAVYVAAIVGLINTELAKKMAKTLTTPKSEYTQLWQLTTYFKHASTYAVATIVISSIALLIPEQNPEEEKIIINIVNQLLAVSGLIVYALNLMFLCLVLRFMLNRQIWDK